MGEVEVSMAGVAERRGPEKEFNPELWGELTPESEAGTGREPVLENSRRAEVWAWREI